MEEWSIGFKNLNKILPPLFEHLAREKKSHVITSRPPVPNCAGLPALGYFDDCFTTEAQRSQRFQMQQDSLPPNKSHRLKRTWIALSGKNELVHFFHNGLSICPNVPSLGPPLCGSFKLCKTSVSAYSVCGERILSPAMRGRDISFCRHMR